MIYYDIIILCYCTLLRCTYIIQGDFFYNVYVDTDIRIVKTKDDRQQCLRKMMTRLIL